MGKEAYKLAGVDIDKGNQAVTRIREMAKQMGVGEIGKFSGFFPIPKLDAFEDPVLVSSADGVGTKLKLAFMMDRHDTIGEDIVNHCVDDILVYGSRPLFFLDYIAMGVLNPDTVGPIVSGMMKACVENEMLLLGGETAEMPGFYTPGEYDVAGFIVGLLDRSRALDGRGMQKGDVLLGLPSTGLHTNGYSLARHIVFSQLGMSPQDTPEGWSESIGEALLRPHRSYLKPIRALQETSWLKGCAHITGGGFLENIPRILPDGLGVRISQTWPVPALFDFLVEKGEVSFMERHRVFNMGIGMVLVVDRQGIGEVTALLDSLKEPHFLMGEVVPQQEGAERVHILSN